MALDRVVDSAELDGKLTAIADAIRVKTGASEQIPFDDLAKETLAIDRLKPMTIYPDALDNGFYGNMAARIAASYHFARLTELDHFVYNRNSSVFSNDNPRIRDTSKYLSDSGDNSTVGYGRLDCSSFIGLVLRGIPYDRSPFAKHPHDGTAEGNKWTPAAELPEMYGSEGWEMPWLDKQPSGMFNDIGFAGYSTIRLAADYGEYFYKYGKVLFDEKVDGSMTAERCAEMFGSVLRAGDIICWANDDDSTRFRQISHVGIVAEDKKTYFHATGSGDDVILCSSVADDFAGIRMICRPDYRPAGKPFESVPVGVNLLGYPWAYGTYRTYTRSGIAAESVSTDTLKLTGTATAAAGIELNGNVRDLAVPYLPLTLTPGTYELSGMDGTGIESNRVALQLRFENEEGFTEDKKCYSGHTAQFTVTEDTAAIVRLYFASGETVNCNVTPTLKRIS